MGGCSEHRGGALNTQNRKLHQLQDSHRAASSRGRKTGTWSPDWKPTLCGGEMASPIASVLLLALLHTVPALPVRPTNRLNDRPIIGILAPETSDRKLQPFGKAYIPSSYVKYLESAGCRVVPVRPNLTSEDYKIIFHSINGILFPGGSVDLQTSEFVKTARLFYKLALEAFDSGDHFPIWGTCLGAQLLTVLTAGEVLLSKTHAENISLPLNLTQAASTSLLFSDIPPDLMQVLPKENLTANFHHFGIRTQDFYGNENLRGFYSVLSTNADKVGVEFVSTLEGKKYPIYGVQWHPEVARFQWKKDLAFPHSHNAVRLSSSMADFFVNEARKSSHHFTSVEEEEAALIYNYQPLYMGNITGYEQVYFF